MKLIILLVVLVGGWYLVNYFLAEKIPRDATTNARLWSTQLRIQAYAADHHQLPEKLSDLPKTSNQVGSDLDGWGRPLIYAPQPDGSVVLGSMGKDGNNNARSIRFSTIDMGIESEKTAETMTFVYMGALEGQIDQYVAAHHRLPNSLSDVTNLDPVDLNDGWDQPLLYTPQADGSVILISHGKPGSQQIFSVQFNVPGLGG